MIVADTNIISYLFLPTSYSEQASQLYLRQQIITLQEALMLDHEFTVTSLQVLILVHNSSCSAYDCEFVALAK